MRGVLDLAGGRHAAEWELDLALVCFASSLGLAVFAVGFEDLLEVEHQPSLPHNRHEEEKAQNPRQAGLHRRRQHLYSWFVE